MKTFNLTIVENGNIRTRNVRAHNFKHAIEILFEEFENIAVLRTENSAILTKGKMTRFGREYVTHKYGIQSGTVNKYWGHYITDFDKAYTDFINR